VRLVFLGRPGAGKGTQALKFAQAKGLTHVSTGDMLRSAVARGTPAGKKAKAIMEAGKLVSDDIVLEMVGERLDSDAAAGFILDGYPRNEKQAEDLDELLKKRGLELDAAVNFELDESVIVPRMIYRRSCPKDGAVYNIKLNPPKQDGVCDKCGAELVQRKDDREDVVRDRMAEYRRNTEPLGPFYAKKGLLVTVDANGGVDEVAARLEKQLGARASGKR
jgi:adenylate kinase